MADGYYKKVNSTPAVAPTVNVNSFLIDTYSKTVDASTKYQPKEVEVDVDLEQYTDIEITYDQVEQVPWYQQALDAVGNAVVGTLASAGNTVVGLAQGLGEFGEALVDTAAIIGTGAASIFTGAYDLGQWIGGKITGNENWESATKKMWDGTMGFVSKKYVTTAFDNFHQNNPVGKFLDENSFAPFKSTGAVYKVADGVGYIGGIILLSLATAGIGGAATAGAGASASAGTLATVNLGHVATVEVTKQAVINAGVATFAGLGKNTQSAWSDGASLMEGLGYGGAMALWEGGEMFLGSAISGLKLSGFEGIKGQLLNTGAHVALDSIDSASASFVDPVMQMIYAPSDENMEVLMQLVNYDENGNQISNKTWDDLTISEKYNALFRYNGGWTGVGINAAMGGTISLLTEVPDIYKSIKASKAPIQVSAPAEAEFILDDEVEEQMAFPGNRASQEKQGFFDKIFNKRNQGVASLSESQIRYIQDINAKIRSGKVVKINIKNTSELNLAMLDNIEDLSKVVIQIDSGFRNLNGDFKLKYNKERYIQRITYTGREAYSIISKIEDLASRVDMSLPTVDRAHQIYEIIANEYSYMRDYDRYVNGHEVVASLKGITPNNAIGRQGLVCAGYAQLCKEICDRCGIRCEYIRGVGIDLNTGKLEPHAWNVIIDDYGNDIPIDVTWRSTSGREWFGKSQDFARSHKADADELFKNYSPVKTPPVVAPSVPKPPINTPSVPNIPITVPSIPISPTARASLDSVYKTLTDKYGLSEARNVLEKYLNTGNILVITRTNNARNIVSSLDINSIASYLNQKNAYKSTLQNIMTTMDYKYGAGAGLSGLQRYISTGRPTAITSTNGARNAIINIPLDDIKEFLSTINK